MSEFNIPEIPRPGILVSMGNDDLISKQFLIEAVDPIKGLYWGWYREMDITGEFPNSYSPACIEITYDETTKEYELKHTSFSLTEDA